MDNVYLPENLPKMDLPEIPLAVFGDPIAHSLSPLMHGAALDFLGIGQKAKYYKFKVSADSLESVLPKFAEKNFLGLNLTIPLKEKVLQIIDKTDDLSKMCGACNTLKREGSSWVGFNTDGFGIECSLKVNFGKSFYGESILIFGAGGAAKGAAFAAAIGGAKKIYIANRTKEKAEALAKSLRDNGFNAVAYTENWAKKIGVIINATSLGLKESDNAVCDFTQFEKSAVFCDMVYKAKGQTISQLAAQKQNIKSCSGISMLAWQGAKSLQHWFGFDSETLFKTGKLMEQTLRDNAK